MVVDYNCGLNGWCEYFVKNGLASRSAIVARMTGSIQPFRWGDVRASVANDADRMAVFNLAAEHGITDGLIVPVRSRSGHRGDVFVSMPHHLLTPQMQRSLWLIAIAFHKMRDGLRKGAASDARDERAD